jgi:hypothetical protein
MAKAKQERADKAPSENLAADALEALEAVRDIRAMFLEARKGLQEGTAIPAPRLPKREGEEHGVPADEVWPLWRWVGDIDRRLQTLGRRAAECGAEVPRDWYEGGGYSHRANGLSRRLPRDWRYMRQDEAAKLIPPVLDDFLAEAGDAIRKAEGRVVSVNQPMRTASGDEMGSERLRAGGSDTGGTSPTKTADRRAMGAPRFRNADMDRQIAKLWFDKRGKAGLNRYEELIPHLADSQRAYIQSLPGRMVVTGFEIGLCIKNARRAGERNAGRKK